MSLFIFLAILPFSLFCLLLLFRPSTSLLKISLITLVVTVFIAITFWHSPFDIISFSATRGFLISLDILAIIFGAILFLEILKKIKITDNLAFRLDAFSPDLRVQVIILAWFLEIFLEGIAGFGTPSTVVAPMLVALGLSPFKAVVIALLGNSVSVPFGAVGTPLRLGLSGVNLPPASLAPLTAIYGFVGLLIPAFMAWILVSSTDRKFILFRQTLPFALWSGIAFIIPAYLVSFFGVEFPSIIGPIIGLVLVATTTKAGLFSLGSVYRLSPRSLRPSTLLSFQKTVFPYLLFIMLLIIAKFLLGTISVPVPSLSYSINIFNPGLVFILTSIIIAVFSKISVSDLIIIGRHAANKTLEPFLVVAIMSIIVQLMNYSSNNSFPLPSITQTISTVFETQLLPIVAPFVGALGSFITGSATVSGLMFAPSLYSSSSNLGLSSPKILSLAMAGAGIGNMIALSDVLAAKTVADSHTSLRQIILQILPYCLICLALISFMGLV